jgi:hypothetical protein
MRRLGNTWARRLAVTVALSAISMTPALLLTSGDATASTTGSALVGTFTITAGSCSGGVATGTYLRMVLSGGTNASGPYFSNSDSSCSDNSYTPLGPGAAGGLVTGSYQPQPSPAFDGSGNALANQITAPVAFEGVRFATATNSVDPQTGLHVPTPSVVANGSALSGNLQSFGVSWNNQEFNQGSPKPDGSSPGNTAPVTGTYNASTGAYTLQWSSQIVGGPFNGFSAFWNLTGRFIPAQRSTSTPSTPAAGAGSGSQSAGVSTGASTSPGATSATTPAGSAGTTATSVPNAATSTPAKGAVAARTYSTRTVYFTRTHVSGPTGFHAPAWLVALVVALLVLALLGMLWSQRALRGVRRGQDLELEG